MRSCLFYKPKLKNPFVSIHSLGIRLNPDCYQADLDKMLKKELDSLAERSALIKLQWLMKFMQKTLLRLQQSIYFRRDSYWQAAMAEHQQLLATKYKTDRDALNAATHTNDFIEAAYQIAQIRGALWVQARKRIFLSAQEEKQYLTISEACNRTNQILNHFNDVLINLDEKLPQSKTEPLILTPISQFFPREYFSYHRDKADIETAEAALYGYKRIEGDVREWWQLFDKKNQQKPAWEKMQEALPKVRQFIQKKADIIVNNGQLIRQRIQDTLKVHIEHRTQMMMTHAEKLEKILLSLEKILQSIYRHLDRYEKSSRRYWGELVENQDSQSITKITDFFSRCPHISSKIRGLTGLILLIHQSKIILNKGQVSNGEIQSFHRKIQKMENFRQLFSGALCKPWLNLFSSSRRNQYQKECLLVEKIQLEVAQMINPIYGLTAVEEVLSKEKIGKIQITLNQLNQIEETTSRIPQEGAPIQPSF